MTEDELQRSLDVHAAIQREVRKYTPQEVLRYELETLQARYANAIRLISNFVGLLPPPDVTTPDGRVFQFNTPDPHDTLRRLRDAVDRMREGLQEPPAPGFDALALRRGIEHALNGMYPAFPIDYNVRNHLARLLSGIGGGDDEAARLRNIENMALRVASARRDGVVTDKAALDNLDAALEATTCSKA